MTRFARDDDRVVIVIGSGAAGGVIARELTQAGISVVLIEAGRRFDADEFTRDEWTAYTMLTWQDRRHASGSWRVAKDHPTRPVWHSQALGGTTNQWMGVALRLQDHEFRARSTYGEVENADLTDWPIDADELRPYYDRAERIMGVSGLNGLPVHPPSNNYRILAAGAETLGYKSVGQSPLAILTARRDGRGPSLQDGFTIQGDRSRAKWSTLYVDIPAAMATGHLDLRTECRAVEIEIDAAGRACAVISVDAAGERLRQTASAVVVAANTVETPRLLLASRSGRFPNGLGNGSDMVGRCYMRHVMATVWSVFDRPIHMNRGEPMTGLVTDEARHDSSRGFSAGYYIETNAMSLPAMAMLLEPGLWGSDLTSALESYANMAGMISVGEDMPQRGNRVTLVTDQLDAFGVPVGQVHYDDHENDTRMRKHGYEAMTAIHKAAGAIKSYCSPPFPATHNLGTARMSVREEDGVVDKWGLCFEVPNVMIAGGPIFPTSAAANPTLTIVALALRQAEHLVAELRRGDFV